MNDSLTDLERKILDFESRRWNYPGAKDAAILAEFDLSPWRYQQYVQTLVRRPAALAAYPQLVHRLQRLTETRRRQRAG